MLEKHFDEWPVHLPELGQLIHAQIAAIMQQWEDLVEKRWPTSERTKHRVALRDHLPQFLKSLGRDLITSPAARTAQTNPAAREHGLQRWRQGYDLELVIRDYQMMFHAILEVAREALSRDLTSDEVANLSRHLHEASVVAIRTFVSFSTESLQEAKGFEAPQIGLFDSGLDAVYVATLDGTIIKWNQGATKVYGYEPDEILGSNVSTLSTFERRPELERCLASLGSGKAVEPIDTIRRRSDGAEVIISFAATPLRDQEGEVNSFLAVERDVSDRVRAAEALREALKDAEQANRTKSEFLANVSHELRTPMNAILGMTELALEEELTPELRDYLETSHDSAETLLALVNDVLDISKLEAAKFALDEVPFSLRELLDDTLRSVGSRALRKGIKIACQVSNKVPDALHGDPLRLRQILTNLVGNAVKFTDGGEIVVEVNLDVKSGRSCLLRFSVADTGIGISEEDQKRIFAPFTQVDASTTRRFAGTGLGLAIAGHLINCFRGQFWVQSEVGVGSIFYFTTRFSLADEVESIPLKPKQPIDSLRGLPVLVADDNDTSRSIIGRLLQDWQMKPILAGDAATALEKLNSAQQQGESIPLILIDALMPACGFELASKIKADKSLEAKTILMISSTGRLIFKDRVDEAQVDLILEKPISESNLLDAILSTLSVASLDPKGSASISDSLPPRRTLEVLLVEDTPANRKVVERILGKRGHRVTSASNGREALDIFYHNPFDVILMDIQMPSMDGIQATEAIRAYESENNVESHIPIIAMTAHAMAGDRRRCLAAGMDDYVSKPISIHKVVEVVEKHGLCRESRKLHSVNCTRVDPSDEFELSPTRSATRVEIMNLKSALERLGGDEELLDDLIGFYLEDYPSLIQTIDESLAAGDSALVERAAHSLKSLAANFDATRCNELAQNIESAAKKQELQSLGEQVAQLHICTDELAQALVAHRDGRKS